MTDMLETLKKKRVLSRQDITDLFESIGAPGEKQDEKRSAMEELSRINRQGHDILLTIESYPAF